MKQILFFIFTVSLFCWSCSSVPTSTPPPAAKVSVALSFGASKIVGQSDSYLDPLGLQFGVMFHVRQFDKKLSFKTEINASKNGAKYKETNGLEGEVKLAYVNAPLIFRFQEPSGFFAEGGLQPGFLVSAKDEYNGNSYDFKNHINTFDLGLPVGFGYEFKNGIGLGARVIYGVTNINKNDPVKDHNFLALARVTYGFKSKK